MTEHHNPPEQREVDAITIGNAELRAAKTFWLGTHRVSPPGETLERIRPHFRAVGLTRLADITGLDRVGVPVVLGFRPNSPTLSNSSGKGVSVEAATVSAAMEAIELDHAERVSLPALDSSYEENRTRSPRHTFGSLVAHQAVSVQPTAHRALGRGMGPDRQTTNGGALL